jgi:hypothetical protein
MTTVTTQPALVEVSRPRRIGFIVLATLLALFTGLAMGGIPALVQTFTVTGHDVVHRVHYIHWFAYMGVLVAVPLAALAFRRTVAPAQQAVIAVAAFVVAASAGRMFDPGVVIFPVLIGLLLFLHPRRADIFRGGEGFSAPWACWQPPSRSPACGTRGRRSRCTSPRRCPTPTVVRRKPTTSAVPHWC